MLIGVVSEWPWAIRRLVPDNPNDLMPIDRKREKLKKRLGIILIVGVAGELASLPFSLIDSAQTNNQAANSLKEVTFLTQSNLLLQIQLKEVDPLNAPINSVSATLKLRVKGVKDAQAREVGSWAGVAGAGVFAPPKDATDAAGWGMGGISFLSVTNVTGPGNKQIYGLTSDSQDIQYLGSGLVYGTNGWRGVVVRFHENEFLENMESADAFTVSNRFNLGQPVRVFNDVNAIFVQLPFFETNVLIVSGNVEVKVNGSRWTFPIPPQRSAWGCVSSEITTNASGQIIPKILPIPLHDFVFPPRWTNIVYTGE